MASLILILIPWDDTLFPQTIEVCVTYVGVSRTRHALSLLNAAALNLRPTTCVAHEFASLDAGHISPDTRRVVEFG